MKIKSMAAVVTALIMVMMITFTGFGAAGSTSTLKAIDQDQTLNLSLNDITTLNSLKVEDTYSLTVLTETMEGLTRNENDGKKDIIKPAGATSWDISKDKKVWTFHLRNYNWSDGKKVTAGDYVYAWKALLDPKTASSYASFIYCVKGAQEYNQGKGSADAVGVKALDDNTFQVTLNQPVPYFGQITAFKCLLPVRKDILTAQGDKYGTTSDGMVFNGPFVVDQWVRGSKVVLKKNPKFWDAANVKLQTVNLIVINEAETEMKMFQSQQIDVINAPDPAYYPKLNPLVNSGELTLAKGFFPETRYIAFNTQDKDKLLTNAKIRQALSISIDRASLCKNIYKDYSPAYGWIPTGLTTGTVEFRKRVPEPFKQYMNLNPKTLFQQGLKELGLDPNKKYTISLLQQGQSSLRVSLSEYYQNVWQTKLGINVKIDVVADFGELSQRCRTGNYEIAIRDWVADFNDPISFFNIFRSADANNTALYNSKQYDSLIAQADVESDATKRIELEKQAENLLIAKDCAVAPVYYGDSVYFTRSYVKGIQYPLFITSFEFKNAYIQGK